MSDTEALLRWYLTLTLVTVAMWPLVVSLAEALGPVRYGLARPLGIVMLTALVWWPAAAFGLPFSRTTLVVGIIVAGAPGWIWWLGVRRQRFESWPIVGFEAVWLVAFLAYAWFRAHYPDIINTEKPMDIALLSSTARSTDVPAPDPWLSGSAINYYYFGYQTIAASVKLAGVPTSVGFNLALATLFASTATAGAVVGAALARIMRLSRPFVIAAAGAAMVLLVFAGNLETPRRLIRDGRATIDAGWWDGVGWQASRVIVDTDVHSAGDLRPTINEFPAFSFVLGDLHPHVITYPLLASVVALAIALAVGHRPGVLRLAVIGALIGLLYASNSWDAPLGLLLAVGALALHREWSVRDTARDTAIVATAAFVMALPFILSFDAPVGVTNAELPRWLTNLPVIGTLSSTFGVVYWRPSSAEELLIVHGPWIAAFAGFAWWALRDDASFKSLLLRTRHVVLTAGLLLLGIAVIWAPALLLIGVPLLLALRIVMQSPDRGIRILAGVFAVGFALVFIPEFFFLQDVFLDRMNTVFKLYFQAWLLLSIASAAAVLVIAARARPPWRGAAVAGAALVTVAMLTYTPLSAWDWTSGMEHRYGLDGRAYLERSAASDLAAITWLESHAADGDTIVEAPGCSYLVMFGAPMNRVSAYTGLPTTIGWYGHQEQWRRGEGADIYQTLNQRTTLANAILDGDVRPELSGARFVVLGNHERHGAERCDRVTERENGYQQRLAEAGWVVAFESDETQVFVSASDPLAPPIR